MKVYRILAYLVAAAVAFQAATIAYGVFALGKWVDAGGVVDKAAFESGKVGGETGFNLHGVGADVVSVIVLALLVTSFFAKVPGGVKWALIVFGLVVLQWVLAFVSFGVPAVGPLHGVNAVAIFAVAVMAGMRTARAVGTKDVAVAEVVAPV